MPDLPRLIPQTLADLCDQVLPLLQYYREQGVSLAHAAVVVLVPTQPGSEVAWWLDIRPKAN